MRRRNSACASSSSFYYSFSTSSWKTTQLFIFSTFLLLFHCRMAELLVLLQTLVWCEWLSLLPNQRETKRTIGIYHRTNCWSNWTLWDSCFDSTNSNHGRKFRHTKRLIEAITTHHSILTLVLSETHTQTLTLLPYYILFDTADTSSVTNTRHHDHVVGLYPIKMSVPRMSPWPSRLPTMNLLLDWSPKRWFLCSNVHCKLLEIRNESWRTDVFPRKKKKQSWIPFFCVCGTVLFSQYKYMYQKRDCETVFETQFWNLKMRRKDRVGCWCGDARLYPRQVAMNYLLHFLQVCFQKFVVFLTRVGFCLLLLLLLQCRWIPERNHEYYRCYQVGSVRLHTDRQNEETLFFCFGLGPTTRYVWMDCVR